jgi:hypothetical protein
LASASSLSTFLDVTQGATGVIAPASASTDADRRIRAKVLVAVGTGPEWKLATTVAGEAGLELDQAVSVLGWLGQNKLVEMRTDDGEIFVRLTEWARKEMRGGADDRESRETRAQ